MIPLKLQSNIFVISGPSGVGKDTILENMAKNGTPYHFVITATTRKPRIGEKEGVNHFFVTEKKFHKMQKTNMLIESAFVFGNYYGVPKTQVEQPILSGKNVLIRVDIQGAERLRNLYPNSTLILIKPFTIDDLKDRLIERGANTKNEITKRLESAIYEMDNTNIFDYEIINYKDQIDKAILELENIINKTSSN
ncbi:MAG: guanylate kinase [Chloroflexi bacterium]|nr:guanylate kinase [Chloroflexota bacterium]|tara:strand:- start:66 stop:647 length:582 start_codon:yes stop_codon:yes gene_type:complete